MQEKMVLCGLVLGLTAAAAQERKDAATAAQVTPFRVTAPVKAPASCPKSSDSIRSRGNDAQDTTTKGPPPR